MPASGLAVKRKWTYLLHLQKGQTSLRISVRRHWQRLGYGLAPSTLDRVDGRLRGKIERDPAMITTKVRSFAPEFLQSKDPDILIATTKMMSYLGIKDYNEDIAKFLGHSSPAVRSAAITSLNALKYEKLESVIKRGMEDKDGSVRAVSVGFLNELDITKENLPGNRKAYLSKMALSASSKSC